MSNKIDIPDFVNQTPGITNKKSKKSKKTDLSDKANRAQANQTNKQILRMAYLFAGMFLFLMGYIGKFVAVDSQEVITNPYNKRQDMFAQSVIRGQIKSSDGQVLAKSIGNKNGKVSRSYPFENRFAHVIGFAQRGKSGIESSENYHLLTSNANILERMYRILTQQKNEGDTVVTTLDSRLQKIAYDALGSHNGSVVVMEPSTGKILAMVSKPDFDPNQIDTNWDKIINEQENSSLLNRGSQGLYPPGSIFKMLTVLEYIRENKDYENYSYTCKGNGIFNGVSIKCYGNKNHGTQNLSESFANSCNTSFVNMGASLDQNKLFALCQDFLFNEELPINFAYNKSKYELNKESDKGLIPQTVIGQGNTLITPLHSTMITAAIANGGVMMKPYLVDHIENYEGGLVRKYTAKSYKEIISSDEAAILTSLMVDTVNKGTAQSLSGLKYQAAGKTGTAEFKDGADPHAWFTGFAPSTNPEIAISVIVENVGAGSTYATPIAKKIMEGYFSNH